MNENMQKRKLILQIAKTYFITFTFLKSDFQVPKSGRGGVVKGKKGRFS